MCILLKLHCAKCDVSSLFCSKVIEENPLGSRLDPPPPLGKGRAKIILFLCRVRGICCVIETRLYFVNFEALGS